MSLYLNIDIQYLIWDLKELFSLRHRKTENNRAYTYRIVLPNCALSWRTTWLHLLWHLACTRTEEKGALYEARICCTPFCTGTKGWMG